MVTVDPRSPSPHMSALVAALVGVGICAVALCGCTLGTGAAAGGTDSAGGAGDRRASSAGALLPEHGLPSGVPFAAGATSVLEAEIVGEHSEHPLGHWRVVVVTAGSTGSRPPTARAEDLLRDAGFVATGRLRGATASGAELWMSKDDTTVRVRPSEANPWLLSYDVTTILASRLERRAECATSYCER